MAIRMERCQHSTKHLNEHGESRTRMRLMMMIQFGVFHFFAKNNHLICWSNLPSMMCDLMSISNFFLLLSLLNSSKYSRTSVKTSFFGTNTVIEPFSFSNSDVKLAVSSSSTNMLYCSFALSVSTKLRVGASSGRSTWCKTDPQLSSSKCTKRAQFTVARLNTLLNTLCCNLTNR